MRILTGRMHGMARYGLELLQALLDSGEDLAVGVLVRRPQDAKDLPSDKRVLAIACGVKPYGIYTQFRLPNILHRMRPELYHCPHYAAPGYFAGPMVLTIHDLIHLRFPQDHGLKHRLFYRWVVGPAARRAGAVFTVSQHSKNDIVELLKVDPDRVVVTPNGVGPAFKPLEEAERKTAPAELGLPGRYILGVGNAKPHKNLAALVQAHRLLKERDPEAPALVLVGLDNPRQAGIQRDDEVVLKAHLDDAELARAYGAATAVCIPSLYEGFGLPALEALACGAPLVVSNRASLPEVVGEAGLLSEPEPEPLAQALAKLLGDETLAQQFRAAGPVQAARFTWSQTARRTLGVYRRVAQGKAPL
jgi:glycosyltransferase involved in cell wall biosynthesis